jgi:hypothetical protein
MIMTFSCGTKDSDYSISDSPEPDHKTVNGKLTKGCASTVANGSQCLSNHVHLFKVDEAIEVGLVTFMCESHV